MTAQSPRIVDNFLIDYAQAINDGFGFIDGDVRFLASIMITISLVMAGLFWALKGEDVMVPFLRKILLIGFFAFLINNWTFLMGAISSSFVSLGIKAGGGAINENVFYSPAAIASLGMEYWRYFGQSINLLTGPVEFFNNFVAIAMLFLLGLVVIAAFTIMALQVFVTLVMFKLVTLAAFVLVPFGILKHTSFMSERALGLVVSYGLKFLTLALIISIGYGVFSRLQPSAELTLNEAFSISLAALSLMMLAMHAPAVASEMITGGPQLGAGAIGGSIAGTSAIALGSAYLGAKASAAGVRLAANPLISAAQAGQITINGQPMSGKNSASMLNTAAGGFSSGENTSSGASTFHSASGGRDEKSPKKSKTLGKSAVAASAAAGSVARNDSSGGISATGTASEDEGE